jgi:hypothetical protein
MTASPSSQSLANNHGKIRLLNELIGRNTFAVTNKRETVKTVGQRPPF